MTPQEMIAEWRKVCSCAPSASPQECHACTVALIDAMERQLLSQAPIEVDDWKQELPKENGFYWVRRPRETDTIVKIYSIESGMVMFGAMVAWIGTDFDLSLCEAEANWMWAGPITPHSA